MQGYTFYQIVHSFNTYIKLMNIINDFRKEKNHKSKQKSESSEEIVRCEHVVQYSCHLF